MSWGNAASYVLGSVAFAAVVVLGAFTIVSLAPRGESSEPPKASLLIDAVQTPLPADPESDRRNRAPAPRVFEATPAEVVDLPLRAAVPSSPPSSPPPSPLPSRPASAGPSVRREAAMLPAPAASPRDHVRPAPEPVALPRLAPEKPRPAPAPAGPQVLTAADIRQMKHSLRLTPEQAVHWPPVENVLHEISAQQAALVRSGQDASGAFDTSTSMRVYFAAQPLLGTLREDQKAQIRARVRAMGFGQVASYL